MRKSALFVLVLAAIAVGMQAKIRLPHILGSNMVIQQNTQVRLWGWAAPNSTVTLMLSWTDERGEAKTDESGWWFTTIPSPAASYTPLSIAIDDGEEQISIDNVLSGEVWVCAGQSNMEMPVKGFGNCPVTDFNRELIQAAKGSQVRSVKIPAKMSATPLEDADCEWRECSMQTVGDFSATGYFFAKLMNQALDIPIGIIEANKGGSRLESWLTKENLETFTQDPVDSVAIAQKWPIDYHRSLLWGNGTFNPIVNYTVKGILYYQGCSNVGDPGDQYSERMLMLSQQWREQFGLGEIPFYFVEIAPYHYDNVNADWGARLREQQFKAATIIPNSGLVCTNDCVYPYETTQIHPAQKQKVGERLAFHALNKTYGMKEIICESPSYKDMQVNGDTVFIHLNNEYGAINRFEGIEGFEVAGADKKFYPATAKHFWRPGGGYWDEAIAIISPKVKAPVAVRYCFKNFQLGNLANAGGLPLFPFRTDEW
ncbi:MAG: 9-O-acetylesterase [Prevotella sp.]|nr:9-O-acetylesterase [Prevotella sp.]